MAKIIAICNQKGGVGKTSTAISLASGLALEGKKSLLIDLDPQGNATSGLGIDKKTITHSIYHSLLDEIPMAELVQKTSIEGLDLIPSNENLSGAEVELVSELGREGRLRKALASVLNTYDYVIIDCPPSFGILTINALTAANSVVIPIQCEYYALEGVSQLVKTIHLIRDNLNERLEIAGILMTMADHRTRLTQEVINEVRRHFTDKVFEAVIPRNIKLSEAPGFGKPIFLYDKESEGAKKYREFVLELLSRYQDQPGSQDPASPAEVTNKESV